MIISVCASYIQPHLRSSINHTNPTTTIAIARVSLNIVTPDTQMTAFRAKKYLIFSD